MPSEAPAGPILAFDCAGPWIAAALEGGPSCFEAMERGQAERLMPLLEGLLAEAGLRWSDIGALAVGVGPGSFSGVRIAVAAARGLALGLGVPAVGLSGFALLRAPAAQDDPAPELVSLPGPRGLALVQRWNAGQPDGLPTQIDPAQPPVDLPPVTRVRGHAAEPLAAALGCAARPEALDNDLPARLTAAARHRLARGGPFSRPAPLYVRPPDAAPPSEAPPVLIG